MSGSFVSVLWRACKHRLDLGLYCHPKEFRGMETEPMLTPREKSPLPEKNIPPEEDRTHYAAPSNTFLRKSIQLNYLPCVKFFGLPISVSC